MKMITNRNPSQCHPCVSPFLFVCKRRARARRVWWISFQRARRSHILGQPINEVPFIDERDRKHFGVRDVPEKIEEELRAVKLQFGNKYFWTTNTTKNIGRAYRRKRAQRMHVTVPLVDGVHVSRRSAAGELRHVAYGAVFLSSSFQSLPLFRNEVSSRLVGFKRS